MYTSAQIHETLKEFFGFDSFKENQEEIVRCVLEGRNTFVLMPTGGGKSLCYQLPALMLEGVAIIVSPLIALMKNQVDAVRYMSHLDSTAHFLNSSLSRSAAEEVRRDVREGKTKMLYVAPESLTKQENVDFLNSVKVSFYAIDEAHCISEWGHDFRPEYRRIAESVERIGKAPIIALTATATDKVRTDIKKNLGILDAVEFKSSFNRPNLYYEIRPKTADIDKEIIKFVKANEGKSGIIYCLSRKRVETLAEILCANDIKAEPYHAGLETQRRSETQDNFLMERINVIVATIAFGMGIDKPDVRFVIHYDMPKSLEGYYQETGRAGRDGGEGNCIAFYQRKDLRKLEKFMEGKPLAEQDIGRQLLAETQAYAESSVCRRKLLLHYFGEEYPQDNCHNCDNCLHPHEKIEASEMLHCVLEAIQATGEKFREDYIRHFISGEATEEIQAYRHDELEEFGLGQDYNPDHWGAVIRQALLSGYLYKEIENYGVLRLTDAGRDFIKNPKTFVIVLDRQFSDEDIPMDNAPAGDALDPILFKMLRTLRGQVARENNVPPYVIFQDPSLEAMATVYPQTEEELVNIPGVGAGKVKRYGKQFCELIKKHCEENEIERPEDMRIRTVANKSKLKVSIIQSIDRKVNLEDLADAQNIDFDTLLDEIDAIVYSGTRLDIDYYIREILDDDQIQDIYQYFRESESDDIDAALDEFGDEFEEYELRLVRIKFLSELAN
ncbi:MAG: DNA helicase RecQ [Bacteroidaceae bacterium]|nr:DNA helicase RecQ [Bacteroidaceae bacterium]MBR7027963.1 DNA helicase RecQ [Bacteroidaceae bacterium]